ncbi:MAG: hypothetical protein QXY73_03950 [Candidatus Bathyarchaeia archaeon]
MEKPDLMELENFTLKGYISLLRYLKQVYKIVPACSILRKTFPYLILRHDVDVSPSAALKMAKVENSLGVKSTYFFMFSNRFYNLLEGNNPCILKQILKLGHEIGLHYHPSQFRVYNKDLGKTLELQVKLLEHLTGKRVYSISRHGPWDKDPFASIRGYINANHPYFRGDLFIHDSCRIWTPAQGLRVLIDDSPKRVQLLTHPENWTEKILDRESLREIYLRKAMKGFKEGIAGWLREPLQNVGNYVNCNAKENGCNAHKSSFALKLQRELNYYNILFRYYMVNTSLGWYFHLLLESFRALKRA